MPLPLLPLLPPLFLPPRSTHIRPLLWLPRLCRVLVASALLLRMTLLLQPLSLLPPLSQSQLPCLQPRRFRLPSLPLPSVVVASLLPLFPPCSSSIVALLCCTLLIRPPLLVLSCSTSAVSGTSFESGSMIHPTTIRGLNNVDLTQTAKTWQFDVSSGVLLQRTEAALRRALPCVPREYHLRMQLCKMLASDPGAPQQIQHTDLPEKHTQHHHSISVLLQLHPTHTAWVQKNQRLTAHDLQWSVSKTFHQYAADLGTLLAFRTDVVHYGPANETDAPRVLVYFLFTRKIVRGAGTTQTFFCQPEA